MDTKWESVGGMNWEIGIDMYILLWGFPGGGVVKNLPRLETQIQSVVQEDPRCHGAAKPVCHNY